MDIHSLELRNQNDHDLHIKNNHETILGKIYFTICESRYLYLILEIFSQY
jgi:hypothetical protein